MKSKKEIIWDEIKKVLSETYLNKLLDKRKKKEKDHFLESKYGDQK